MGFLGVFFRFQSGFSCSVFEERSSLWQRAHGADMKWGCGGVRGKEVHLGAVRWLSLSLSQPEQTAWSAPCRLETLTAERSFFSLTWIFILCTNSSSFSHHVVIFINSVSQKWWNLVSLSWNWENKHQRGKEGCKKKKKKISDDVKVTDQFQRCSGSLKIGNTSIFLMDSEAPPSCRCFYSVVCTERERGPQSNRVKKRIIKYPAVSQNVPKWLLRS